jgi:succinoglycan biosynthesis protein ExoV
MRLFYYKATRNFGDHMNGWLWPALLPGMVDSSWDRALVGIGSLIKSDLNKVPGQKIIFGTGSGYGPMPFPEDVASWKIYCVRGPLTAQALRLPPNLAVGDAAWLIDELPQFKYKPVTPSGAIFIPHWETDLYANWRQPCEMAGITYVTPMMDSQRIMSVIAGAKLALVESLHGAILADYYRVPWVPMATEDRILSFKWLDFCVGLGLPYKPLRMPVTDRFDAMFSSQKLPNTYQFEYLPEPKVEDFPVKNYGARSEATSKDRLKVKLKAMARPVRGAGMATLNAARQSLPWRSLNKRRAHDLALLLRQAQSSPSFLSADGVRAEKLEKLSALAAQLRKDFAKG